MRETRQAARQRRHRRRLMVGTTAGLVVTGLLVCLVMTMQSDRKEDAGRAPATAVANSEETLPPTSPGKKSPTPSPSAGSASPSAGATTPKASPTPSASPSSASPRTAPATSSLAGRIRPKSTYQGVATVYKAGVGDGACSYGPSDDMMIAAMNTTDYETSAACGAYVLVRAANGNSVTVRITNECPLPCAPGQLDLSEQAFAKLTPVSTGRIAITWSLLSPDTAGTISIRYKNGSSPYWCGIQAIGHRNPLARLEVRTGGGWRQLTRTDYNYFLSPDGSGCGGAIRLTDIYGEQLTVNGIDLRPDAVQSTGVQFARH
ncbi:MULTISPECIES: expansin EXLX1 family cellulose-binding protein [unclassified Streptomyces]|uniref:expansin EXLX1 family cellulose-binding protein n=1 Tax=unclassified Streptomyces TaxID=2593676 RepID=UPI0023665C15|nr:MULTISPECIES: expansin EXLX1 family cellulose-binding protein [unclassified Streptomyces]MDF3144575.1 expansin EXLX1 family cellulose-binding protein [Streptomyces sp. T21Q-yed]WDF36309.1 expansin EXLX1 family cellulose-binding protein [Streptomyces sp. T12]